MWGGRIKIIATASANQTYEQQLTYLKPYYTNLSEDDKVLCFLKLDGSWKLNNMGRDGWFSYYIIDANLHNGSLTLEFDRVVARQETNHTTSDITTATNSRALSLCIVEY